jgi:periplasmic copper chaperone A
MRMPWQALAGGLVVAAVGTLGLVRGAQPVATSAPAPTGPPIVVSGAYVRAPAPPTDSAAAYFTVSNTTDTADRLVSVDSGAGETTVLHTAGMTAETDGAVIPAHGKLVLSTGKGHVMIEQLFGTLKPGQNVNLALTFERAGEIEVSAPVVALGAPVPKGGSSS